jgi:hypothetical protein
MISLMFSTFSGSFEFAPRFLKLFKAKWSNINLNSRLPKKIDYVDLEAVSFLQSILSEKLYNVSKIFTNNVSIRMMEGRNVKLRSLELSYVDDF